MISPFLAWSLVAMPLKAHAQFLERGDTSAPVTSTPAAPRVEPRAPRPMESFRPEASAPENDARTTGASEDVSGLSSFTPPPAAPAMTSEAASKQMIVDLAVIDKNLGRHQRISVPMGRVIQYKSIEILPQRCVIDGAAKPVPQHSLLVQIYDRKPHVEASQIYSGWLMAGNTSLSSIEHPYYDLIVFSCTPKNPEELPPVQVKVK